MDLLIEYLNNLPESLIYVFLGLSAFMENLFPPAPGDMIIAFGAFLVGTGRLSFLGVYLSTTIGSLLGFMVLFWLGEYLGKRFFIERDYRFFKKGDIVKAGSWFKKYGYFIITLNRFFPGIRSVISIAAGIYRLGRLKVALLALISCAIWNMIWISVGYTIGDKWKIVEERISSHFARYNLVIIILLAVLVIYVFIRKVYRNSRQRP
jgi:membrane protein DedA with SNARE-associated domain